MDQLRCMQVFVRVVEQGAFVRAADDMGISPASVTNAVMQLEKHLGVRLLHRTTRRLSLTEEGQAYYQDCVRILGQVAEAEDSLSSVHRGAKGRLRISIAQSFQVMEFFPLLELFMRQHPGLSVEIIVTDRAVNLVEEGVDCALRATDLPPHAPLVARRIMQARWLTCAAPGYLARRSTPQTIDDLQGHNCIRFISPSTGRGREWYFNKDGAIKTYTPEGSLALTSLDAAVAAAAAGIGVAQVPDVLSWRIVFDGGLVPLLTDYIAMAQPVMVVYPHNRYLPVRVRAFADFMEQAYPREGWWERIAPRVNPGRSSSGTQKVA